MGGAELQAGQARPGLKRLQVRSDHAIRRHWQLVCCAFSFCWWAYGRLPTEESAERPEGDLPAGSAGREQKETPGFLGGGLEVGEGLTGTVGDALTLLEGVLQQASATGAKSTA